MIQANEESLQELAKDRSAALASILLKEGMMRDLCKLLEDPLVMELIDQSPYKVEALVYIVKHDKHGSDYVFQKIPKLAQRDKQAVMSYMQQQMKQRWNEGIQKGKEEGFIEAINALLEKGMITPAKAEVLLKEKK